MFKLFILLCFGFGAAMAAQPTSDDERTIQASARAWQTVLAAILANKAWADRSGSTDPAYYNGTYINFGISNKALTLQIHHLVVMTLNENDNDGFSNALLTLGELAHTGIKERQIKHYLFAINKLLSIAEPHDFKSLKAHLNGTPCEPLLLESDKKLAYDEIVHELKAKLKRHPGGTL